MKQKQNELVEKLKQDLRFGIEIEAVSSIDLPQAEYHANYESGECDGCDEDCDGDHEGSIKEYYGNYFYAESDGSLQTKHEQAKWDLLTGEFPFDSSASTVELITEEPFKYNQLDTILDDLKRNLEGKEAKLWFNASCGSHVHVSLSKKQMHTITQLPQIFAFRRKVFSEMRKYFNDNIKYQMWKAYYFRHYAKKVTKSNFERVKRDRYSEFNLTLGNRIEIRSTHLMGVNSFDEMKKVYKIFFDAIIYALSYKPIEFTREYSERIQVYDNPIEENTRRESIHISDNVDNAVYTERILNTVQGE